MVERYVQKILGDSAQDSLENRLLKLLAIAVVQLEEVDTGDWDKEDVSDTIRNIKDNLSEFDIEIVG